MVIDTTKSVENRNGVTVADLRDLLAAVEGMPADTLLVAQVKFGGVVRKLEANSRRLRKPSLTRSEYVDFPEPS
jgi:hypothetical protein